MTTINGKLTAGQIYADLDNLRVIGWDGPSEMLWTAPGVRNPGMDGYDAWAYFAADGRYLGPDEHGVEPLFRRLVATAE